MNNKPVAWISLDVLDATHIIKSVVRREQDEQHNIPLYTHPVKELTDKEITQVFDECYPNNGDGDVVTLIDFARAIIKKAQEK